MSTNKPQPTTQPCLAVQIQLDAILAGETASIVGIDYAPQEALSAWRAAAALSTSLGDQPSKARFRATDLSVDEDSVSLISAASLVNADSAAEAADVLCGWFEHHRLRPTVRAVTERVGHVPALTPILDELRARQTPLRTTHAAGLWTPRFEAGNVPQLAWPCAFRAARPPGRKGSPSNGMLAAYLAILVNHHRQDDLAVAAAELGWTRRDAQNWRRRIPAALGPVANHQLYARASDIAAALAAHPQPPRYVHAAIDAATTTRRLQRAVQAPCTRSAPGSGWCPCHLAPLSYPAGPVVE